MTAPRPRSRQPKQLDAGIFQAEISSFALRLAAEGKAAKTIRTYTEAVQWFAATGLPGQARRASWEQVTGREIQQWMAWLLGRYSAAYASNQYRALQQFFKWLAAEDQLPDPMAGLAPPHVAAKLVPVFTPGGADPAGVLDGAQDADGGGGVAASGMPMAARRAGGGRVFCRRRRLADGAGCLGCRAG